MQLEEKKSQCQKVIPTSELDDSITYAKFHNGDTCSLDIKFNRNSTNRLFAYSVKKHADFILSGEND